MLSTTTCYAHHKILIKTHFLRGMSFLNALLFILVISGCAQNNSDGIKPEKQDITESVYASLKVVPELSYFAQSTVTGIVDKVHVAEGSKVYEGDVIFTVKSNTALNRMTDAQLALQQSKANYSGAHNLLQNIQIEIENARQRLKLDSLQFVKLEQLWKKNIGSKNDVDIAELQYETSRTNLELLKKKYRQTARELKNTYEKALNKWRTEQINLNDFTVTALINGIVYEMNKEPGEIVSPQDKMAEIGSENQFKINMEVDELDIPSINVGDTAIIVLDAYPGQTFLTRVTQIFPKKDEQNLTYKVEGQFINPPEKLLYGLAGEANIIVDKRRHVLTIPVDYLKSPNTVVTREGDVQVTTGLKNLEFVEIIAGIDATTILIKPQ